MSSLAFPDSLDTAARLAVAVMLAALILSLVLLP
jgi:hypothetical protein